MKRMWKIRRTLTFLRRAHLVLRWMTVSGSIPGASSRYVTIQPPKANSAFHPSEVGKWVPASAGKAKAGTVSGWTRGVQVKLWDPLRTRAIPDRLRCAFTTRRYINPRLPLPLPYYFNSIWWHQIVIVCWRSLRTVIFHFDRHRARTSKTTWGILVQMHATHIDD